MALSSADLGTSIWAMRSHRRRRERPSDTEQERCCEERGRALEPGRDHCRERNRNRHDTRLRGDQEPARVHDVAQRAGRQGQEKQRQGRGDLDGGNHSRARIEAGHQPRRSRIEHRQPDARQRGRDEDHRERGIAEHSPARLRAQWRLRVDVQFGGQVIRPNVRRVVWARTMALPPFGRFGKRRDL